MTTHDMRNTTVAREAMTRAAPPREITSTQLVLDAARDLHAMGEEITREGLVAATGLKQHIVDERLRVLCGDDRMKRIGRGAFALGEQYHEARAMSKTLLPSGEVKYEVGDQLLELTSYEDGVLLLLACGPINQTTLADATKQAMVAHKIFSLSEPRAMSKTLQPNGMMKYEIGDVTLLLSPAEDRMLCILVAGSSVHIATIEATRQVGMVQALFAQRLAHLEKITRDRNRRADGKAL